MIVRSRTGVRSRASLAGSTPRSSDAELALLDHAAEPEQLGAAAGPDPRRLAAARVVVVQPARDLLLVVGLLAQRQLRHAQHAGPNSNPTSGETHMHRRCPKRCPFTKRATPADHIVTTREGVESCSEPKVAFGATRKSACKTGDSGSNRRSVESRQLCFNPRCAHHVTGRKKRFLSASLGRRDARDRDLRATRVSCLTASISVPLSRRRPCRASPDAGRTGMCTFPPE